MDSSNEEKVLMTCNICNLPFTGIRPFEQHVLGKKHKKQLKKKGRQFQVKPGEQTPFPEDQNITCDICETVFTGIIPYTQHLKSKRHTKVLKKKEAEEDTTTQVEVNSGSELSDGEADLKSLIKEITHEPLESCSICKKQFNDPENYHQHMAGKSHSKRKRELQLLEELKEEFGKLKDIAGICDLDALLEGKEPQLEVKGFDSAGEDELECKGCNKVFSGAASFAQHLMSKAHAKRQNQIKLLEEMEGIKARELQDDGPSSGGGEVGIRPSVDPVLTCDVCSMAFSGPENAKAHLMSKGHQKAMKLKRYIEKKRSSDAQKDVAVKSDELTIHPNEVKSVDKQEKSYDEKMKGEHSDTGSTACESAFADCDEKCSFFSQESTNQVPSENLDPKKPGDSPSDSLCPKLPDDDDHETSENSENLGNDSFVSESMKSEDEDATVTDEGSKEDEIPSPDTPDLISFV